MEKLRDWRIKYADLYQYYDVRGDASVNDTQSKGKLTEWTTDRYLKLIRLKEQALNFARDNRYDYIFVCISFFNFKNHYNSLILFQLFFFNSVFRRRRIFNEPKNSERFN